MQMYVFCQFHQEHSTEENEQELNSNIRETDSEVTVNHLPSCPQDSVDIDTPHINLHMLVGNAATETLRIHGKIKNKELTILIDGGSTHNFIQDRVVKYLGLHTSKSSKFNVMVGNGDKLQCTSSCTNVSVQLGNNQFHIDFYVLPISGADVVLGIQWLKTLGPINTDFNSLSMQFHWNGSTIHLHGITNNKVSEISQTQLKRLEDTKAVLGNYYLATSPILTF